MNDCELLELAAKAAGYELYDHTILGDGVWLYGEGESKSDDGRSTFFWSPLTDDGDALRLAVKLQLTICNEHVSAGAAYCVADQGDVIYPEVSSGMNEGEVIKEDYVATRRAIVLAAAKMADQPLSGK